MRPGGRGDVWWWVHSHTCSWCMLTKPPMTVWLESISCVYSYPYPVYFVPRIVDPLNRPAMVGM